MTAMTTHPAAAGDDPRQLLSTTRELVRGVRRVQRATWFPLLVFAAVTFAAIPVDRVSGVTRTCKVGAPNPGGRAEVCILHSPASAIYWPIALVLAYVAIAVFSLRRSEARGVGSPIRPYVVAGIALAVVLTSAGLWAAYHPPVGSQDIAGLHLEGRDYTRLVRVLSPAAAIGFALIVLAWIERNLLLAAIAAGYLYVVLAPVTFGWYLYSLHPKVTAGTLAAQGTHFSRWVGLPHLVIDGSFLLLAGIGFAIAQRPSRAANA
jgi:hypothetical protein